MKNVSIMFETTIGTYSLFYTSLRPYKHKYLKV